MKILSMAKRSGALPFLPMLGALRSLIGEAANMAKAVNDSKAMRRHDRAMEQGRELYLAPQIHGLYLSLYKRGQGVTVKKKNVKETIKMHSDATTNVQMDMLARRMRVLYFRDVSMRNALPTSGVETKTVS